MGQAPADQLILGFIAEVQQFQSCGVNDVSGLDGYRRSFWALWLSGGVWERMRREELFAVPLSAITNFRQRVAECRRAGSDIQDEGGRILLTGTKGYPAEGKAGAA